VIQYTEKPTRVKQWGYEVVNANSGSPVALKWFKLLLQDQLKATESHKPTQTVHSHLNGLTLSENRSNSSVFIPPTTTYANDTAHAIECLKISVVTVISDFLKLVLDLTKETIDRTYGEKFVRGSKMEYILTVPAIWTDLAKDLMVKAAESAGFGTFRVDFKLIGEPESAAVYSLKKIKPNSLKASNL
jgi:molecular chaperone DnaK (HSP70)